MEYDYVIAYYNRRSGKLLGYLDKNLMTITNKLDNIATYSQERWAFVTGTGSLSGFLKWKDGEPFEYYQELLERCSEEEIFVSVEKYKQVIRKYKLNKIKNYERKN